MKKFILIVTYGTGKVTMLTKTPDLVKAIEEFNEINIKTYGVDKASMLPDILKAEILPVMYVNKYKG